MVFPEGARSPDGHMQRFRHGTARLCIEAGIGAVPIGIRGAYQAMPKGKNWPRNGQAPGAGSHTAPPLFPAEGETHQAFSLRMTQAVAELHDEDRIHVVGVAAPRRARRDPDAARVPRGPEWRRRWEGSRPLERRGPDKTWK